MASTKFRPTGFKYTEFEQDCRTVHLPPGVTLEDILSDPECWAHLAEQMKVGMLITVCNSDYTIDADLRVVTVDPRKQWAQVVRRGEKVPERLGHSLSVDADGWGVDEDRVLKWVVLHKGEVRAKHLPDREAALRKLAELKGSMRKAG